MNSLVDFDRMADAFDRGMKFLDPTIDAVVDRVAGAASAAARILDIACGTGEPGLSVLSRTPAAFLLGADASPMMVDAARRKAAKAGLRDVRFEVMDAMNLDVPSAGFDVVVSRFGAMSFGDPVQGAAEIVRVLRPGGLLVVMVWDATSKNILTYAMLTALAEHASPTTRSLLDQLEQLAMPGRRERWLRDAGMSEVDGEFFAWSAEFPDEATMWELQAGPGLFQDAVGALDADELAEARTRFGRILAEYRRPDGTYALPYSCRIIRGRR